MKLFGKYNYQGVKSVCFILNKNKLCYQIGTTSLNGSEVIGVTSLDGEYFSKEEIYAISPDNRVYHDVIVEYYQHQRILEEANKDILKDHEFGEGQFDLKELDVIDYNEYQRRLFEERYYDKENLKHVNWFAPSACYYPIGWYNLGGEKSKESDRIGEQVSNEWEMWKSSLYWNKRIKNISSQKVNIRK